MKLQEEFTPPNTLSCYCIKVNLAVFTSAKKYFDMFYRKCHICSIYKFLDSSTKDLWSRTKTDVAGDASSSFNVLLYPVTSYKSATM